MPYNFCENNCIKVRQSSMQICIIQGDAFWWQAYLFNSLRNWNKMKIDAIALTNLLLIIVIFIFATIQEVNSKGGGRGGGGGSRGGGSRYSGGGWGSRGSSGGYKSISGSSTKSFAPKSSSTWKKAATFGAGAYVGYKVSSMVCIRSLLYLRKT